MPRVLVSYEICLSKICTAVATAMLCTVLTVKVVGELMVIILWGNTLDGWVNMAQNGWPGIIRSEQVWYPLQRLNFVHCHLLEILATPPEGHPAWRSALESNPGGHNVQRGRDFAKLSSTRRLMCSITNLWMWLFQILRISPMRIWTQIKTSQKSVSIITSFHILS